MFSGEKKLKKKFLALTFFTCESPMFLGGDGGAIGALSERGVVVLC